MPVEDKDAARPEREEALDKSSPATAHEMYIPDYVMLDFGSPKERGTGREASSLIEWIKYAL